MGAIGFRKASRWVVGLALAGMAASGCKAQSEGEAFYEEDGATDVEGLSGTMTAGAALRVTVDLNLRDQPSTAGKVLQVMPVDSKVTLQSGEPSNGFYQIVYQGTVGWSSGKYLEPANNGPSDPAAATLTTTGDVNLRSGPGTSYSVLTVIPVGSEVKVEEPTPTNGFYHVTHEGLTGWSSGKYLTASGPGGGSDAVSATPFANGQLWKFKAKTLAVNVAVFVPAAAAQASEVEVLFYAHGLNVCSPVAKSPPLSFVTDAPFSLGNVVDASGRPVVLAVPWLDWEHLAANGMATGGSNHKIGLPANLNGVIGEVLSQVGKQRGTDAPALTALYVAGHSRAYGVLNPLAAANADAQMKTGALAKLTQVWGLDTGYACSPISNWKSWMKGNPSLQVTQDYRAGTGTADCGQQFAGLVATSNGQLSVHAVPEAHCSVPSTELPVLLGSLP